MTMYSFYKCWSWGQLDFQAEKTCSQILTYTMFRYSWYAYCELLDIDYPAGFLCSKCGPEPDIVVMDGITLGLRIAHLPWESFLKNQQDKPPTCMQGTSHNMRIFVNNQKARKLLAKYSCSDEKVALTINEFDDLCILLSMYQPSMNNLMRQFRHTGHISKAPSIFYNLLSGLAKNSPVTSLLHPDEKLFDLLDKLCQNNYCIEQDPPSLKFLQETFPVLHKFILDSEDVSANLVSIYGILAEMKSKCLSAFSVETQTLPQVETQADPLAYFPQNKILVNRGHYVLDSTRLVSEISSDCEKLQMIKGRKGHKTLVPGLFTLLCHHGKKDISIATYQYLFLAYL